MTNGIYGQGGKGGYFSNLWRGIQETARAHGVKLVCFLGGSFPISPSIAQEYQRNQVFDLVSDDNIDGLILSSATLVSSFGINAVADVCARFKYLPIVSIGIPIDHYPFLTIDNRIGEKAMVDHLINVHGYRRIAFIRGPENNQEAEERFQAYQEALVEHGIPLDPNLIIQGDFVRASGAHSAHLLLDEIRLPFDAVVAANDNMALGFIAALQDTGIQVPSDIAVVGFDDIPDAGLSFPPLTTVYQPIYELGQRAVERLLDKMQGVNSGESEVLPTELSIRNSCGCSLYERPSAVKAKKSASTIWVDQAAPHGSLIEEMVDALDCSAAQRPQACQQVARLVDSLEDILADKNPDDMKPENLSTVLSSFIQNSPLLPWHRAVSIYSQRIFAQDKKQNKKPVAPGWQDIWQISAEFAWFSQSYQRLRELYFEEVQSEHIREVSQALVTTFNLSEIMETAWRLLPSLGIKGCWISLYEETGGERQQVRLKLAYDQSGRIDLPDDGKEYPACWLLPKDIMSMDRSFEIIVNSLFFGDTIFGLVIFEMDEPDQRIIDMVTTHISTALQGTKVVNELQRIQGEFHQQANTDLLTGIYNRRMLYTLAEPAFELARRHNLPLSVAMIDLDNFKSVNDRYGHTVGDHVLRALSKFVQTQIRGTDIFGRFGGEEFLIILPETTVKGAINLVERIRKSIENQPFVIEDFHVPLTLSAGVATFVHDQDQRIDNLIDKADQALYRAKGAGKNCVST